MHGGPNSHWSWTEEEGWTEWFYWGGGWWTTDKQMTDGKWTNECPEGTGWKDWSWLEAKSEDKKLSIDDKEQESSSSMEDDLFGDNDAAGSKDVPKKGKKITAKALTKKKLTEVIWPLLTDMNYETVTIGLLTNAVEFTLGLTHGSLKPRNHDIRDIARQYLEDAVRSKQANAKAENPKPHKRQKKTVSG